ncbi:hypothetical protein KIW84_072196 [Lathyrus oleraceus]|uniref:Zinc-ribbon domain-containing protein n=1 Tax=Pisum sativum TaxID=3888 RepID=A0A9D4VLG8_PEA|nr:hypothetical protein KIW84_072196 [Pisum sativum]
MPGLTCFVFGFRFKRLTGRNEVAISANDYKFYSPRHKYRRGTSISLPNIQDIPSYSGAESSTTMTTTQGFRTQTPNKHHLQSLAHQPQFHPVLQSNQIMHQSQHAGPYSHNHQNGSPSHLSEISHSHQPSISQHMSCLQSLTGGHVGGRMHMLPPSPAKFCDECGAPYLRETSKFCSECGSKRLGT